MYGWIIFNFKFEYKFKIEYKFKYKYIKKECLSALLKTV